MLTVADRLRLLAFDFILERRALGDVALLYQAVARLEERWATDDSPRKDR